MTTSYNAFTAPRQLSMVQEQNKRKMAKEPTKKQAYFQIPKAMSLGDVEFKRAFYGGIRAPKAKR